MKRFSLWMSLAAVIGLGSAAEAADIYVSRASGSNKNPGTKEKPKKLLWKVMNKLKEGDSVHVAEGQYFGKGKSGVMPAMSVSKVKIIGGYKADFSERDPFKYLSIIGAPGDRQGDSREVFQWISQKGLVGEVTLDGFCIDRGGACYYSSDGEPGANKRIEGHVDNTAWGYQAINGRKSGSDPAIELIGKGGKFVVRNMLIVNSPWWGISIKAGGTDDCIIENNLILVSRGRGIEAITGGGWGKPKWIIRNNTVAFGHRLGATEGRALSIDPKKGNGSYVIEKNVLAFMDGGGVTTKFNPPEGTLTLNDNLFYFCRRADFCVGGKGLTNAEEFEDELECDNEENGHGLPKFVAKMSKKWLDRWSIRTEMVKGDFVNEDEIMAARKSLGLGAFEIPNYKESFPSYKKLPGGRNNYNQSRYPHPMKKGELINWSEAVLPVIGADGPRGIQPFKS